MKTKIILIIVLVLLAITLFIHPRQLISKTTVPPLQLSSTSSIPFQEPQKPLKMEVSLNLTNISLKPLIVAEFANYPAMVDVVYCESRFKQFGSNGKPLISKTSDVGIMQINQVHWKDAKARGLDIFNSVDDNIAMGKIILQKQGIKAWSCYNKTR